MHGELNRENIMSCMLWHFFLFPKGQPVLLTFLCVLLASDKIVIKNMVQLILI